ncbi:MAG: hypothetical protein LBG22_11435 [Treponema sp.]|nr:hypothetical protein [Treponema sp.]
MKRRIQWLFYRILPAFLAAITLANALAAFTLKYTDPDAKIPLLINMGADMNRLVFLLNFYIPFLLAALAIYGLIFSAGFYMRGICLLSGVIASILSVYILEDLFTVNVFIYAAYIIAASLTLAPPKGFAAAAGAGCLFLFFSLHPSFMGKIPGGGGGGGHIPKNYPPGKSSIFLKDWWF